MEPGVYREVFWISYHLRSVDGSWIAIIDVIASVFVRPGHNMRNIAVLLSLQYYCQYKHHEACWQHNNTGPGSILSCRMVVGNCVSMESEREVGARLGFRLFRCIFYFLIKKKPQQQQQLLLPRLPPPQTLSE